MHNTTWVAVAVGALGLSACLSKDTDNSSRVLQLSGDDGIRKVQLCVGTQHACGIRPDGSVNCWKSNQPVTRSCERLFDRAFPYAKDNSVPECGQTEPPSGPFTELACGMAHTCGIRPNGHVECWGSNKIGQLDVPTDEPFERIRSVGNETCGVTREGNVHCWGWHKFFSAERWIVADIARMKPDYAAWGGFENFTGVCGLLRGNRERVCISWNQDYRSSDETGWVDSVEGTAAFDRYHCGIRGDGSLKCTTKYWSPPPGRFKQLARYGYGPTACALSDMGSVTCFAKNDLVFPRTAPTLYLEHNMHWSFPLPGDDYTEIAAGIFGLCARTREGSIKCAYENRYDKEADPTPEFGPAT